VLCSVAAFANQARALVRVQYLPLAVRAIAEMLCLLSEVQDLEKVTPPCWPKDIRFSLYRQLEMRDAQIEELMHD
jgi:hypothetical protein